MIVLGINGFGKNSSACILQDGKMVSFVESERFTRFKGDVLEFPTRAVIYCMKHSELQLGDVDRIAFGWDATKYPWYMARFLGRNFFKYRGGGSSSDASGSNGGGRSSSVQRAVDVLMEYQPGKIKTRIAHGLLGAGFKGKVPPIEFVPHHLAHAYSTYFCSPFREAGILTLDGSGEDTCTQLSVASGDEIRVLENIPIPHSLGWFYAAITEYLGFIPDKDEGKVMGLAAYGEARSAQNRWLEPLSKVIKVGQTSYEIDPRYTKLGAHNHGTRFTDSFVDLLTAVDKEARPIGYGEQAEVNGEVGGRHMLHTYIDLAWAAQELLEQAGIKLAKRLVQDHGVKNLCVAGGVGLNCKMNGAILEQAGCDEVFAQPASNDAGVALGAAMYVAQKAGDDIRNPLDHTYFGPSYSNDEIRKLLDGSKVSYRQVDDPSEAAAELLEPGKLVSWFQGRMEFGPRALGNRSILANPVFPNIKDRVNAQVKYREMWRPFCPSLANEVRDEYVQDCKKAPFMMVAYRATEGLEERCPSVVHIDQTIRPQTVTSESNPRFHSLIQALGKRTGQQVVLNTSFNVRGEPIVCHPLEALRCFYATGLDAMVIGDFVLEKPTANSK